MPSVRRAKSCFRVLTLAADGFRGGPAGAPAGAPAGGVGGGGGGGGSCTRSSPLKPAAVTPVSCAGTSSFRTYLSGSSTKISNSIGTRFAPNLFRSPGGGERLDRR